jgi:molybdate transport system substrate-binding protein
MKSALSRLARSFLSIVLYTCSPAWAESVRIAAASDLKFAMDEIVFAFRDRHPEATVDVVYGSSGRFHAQIQAGAPYDLYFSADISYAESLQEAGFAASPVTTYAYGRIVLWSNVLDARSMTLESLADNTITRIAIANPRHAPYGARAEEAMRTAGVWELVERKLVYGENIAQTAQFVQSGNAQLGIIALALAMSPELARQGGYGLIPDTLHAPLQQGFIVTRRAQENALAAKFAEYMQRTDAREIMVRHGFVMPDEYETR